MTKKETATSLSDALKRAKSLERAVERARTKRAEAIERVTSTWDGKVEAAEAELAIFRAEARSLFGVDGG